MAPDRVELVYIGEYPGIAHFGGLGELEPRQLGLLEAATPLTAEALDLGAAAWAALRSGRPRRAGRGRGQPLLLLRFLGEAFDRLGREYPSTRDGLSLTEQRLWPPPSRAASRAPGRCSPGWGSREARPFMGLFCFRILAPARRDPGAAGRAGPARQEVTAATACAPRPARGCARKRHVALNGVDRWVGGVHLHGPEARWRWDEGHRVGHPRDRLISPDPGGCAAGRRPSGLGVTSAFSSAGPPAMPSSGLGGPGACRTAELHLVPRPRASAAPQAAPRERRQGHLRHLRRGEVCAAYALAWREPYGTWGGLSRPTRRSATRASTRSRPASPTARPWPPGTARLSWQATRWSA